MNQEVNSETTEASVPKRVQEWDDFAKQMHDYIETFTVKKYKSSVTQDIDLIELADAKLCVFNVLKYAMRMHNGRGKAYDAEKMAHYAQMAWTKIKAGDNSMIDIEKAG